MHPKPARALLTARYPLGSHSFSHPDPWSMSLGRRATEYLGGRCTAEKACEQEIAVSPPSRRNLLGYVGAVVLDPAE
jgi:hypothetical protein